VGQFTVRLFAINLGSPDKFLGLNGLIRYFSTESDGAGVELALKERFLLNFYAGHCS